MQHPYGYTKEKDPFRNIDKLPGDGFLTVPLLPKQDSWPAQQYEQFQRTNSEFDSENSSKSCLPIRKLLSRLKRRFTHN